MSEADEPAGRRVSHQGGVEIDEALSPTLAPALKVINGLVNDGVIEGYAIGGSVAILYYSEPFETNDIDVFCYVRPEASGVYKELIEKYLRDRGYGQDEHGYMRVEGIPFQFWSVSDALESEALDSAVAIEVAQVPTRVFQLEHAMALKVKADRVRDWTHLAIAMDSANPDLVKLKSILERHDLLETWRRGPKWKADL